MKITTTRNDPNTLGIDWNSDGPSHQGSCIDCGAEIEIPHAIWEMASKLAGSITAARKCSAKSWDECDSACFERERKRYIDPFSNQLRCFGPPLKKSEIGRCDDCSIAFNDMHNRRVNASANPPKQSKEERYHQQLLDEIGDG
jgi:hypothetical protein